MSETSIPKCRLCHCRWFNCESLRTEITSKTIYKNLWSDSIIRIQYKETDPNLMSINQYSLYKSLCVHVLSNEHINKIPTSIYLYPHHFPIAMLQWQSSQTVRTSFTKPLVSEVAKCIQENNTGSQIIYDNSNTVSFYHKLIKGKYKKISRTKVIIKTKDKEITTNTSS